MNAENKNPYETPEAVVAAEKPRVIRDEGRGRRAYILQIFLIWIIFPLLASFFAVTAGIDDGGVSKTTKFNLSNEAIGSGYKLDLLYVWYIQLPLFIYYTRDRVLDSGLNQWFTLLFMLPVVNLAMWFWPPKYK